MQTKGFLMVISGPSGAGKGTICKEFLKKHPEIVLSVSATTRKPRVGEINKKSYYFLSHEEFLTMIENQQLLEHVFVFDHFYGTPKAKVLEHVENGEIVILEIEIDGAKQIKEKFPEAVMVFILPPSLEELSKRIQTRGTEDDLEITKRLRRAWKEIDMLQDYSYFLINDKVEECVSGLESIVEAEKHRVNRNIGRIKAYYQRGSKNDLSSY